MGRHSRADMADGRVGSNRLTQMGSRDLNPEAREASSSKSRSSPKSLRSWPREAEERL